MFTSSAALPDPNDAEAARERRRKWLAAALQSARDGDDHGLDRLVRELTPLLWHVARSQGLEQQDAVDVVQTTWLNLVRALTTINNPEGLLSWLFTTTQREAWRVRATRRAEQPTGLEYLTDRPDLGPPVEDGLLTNTERERLWSAVGRLSPTCQQLLRIVSQVDRPDYRIVSQALGMPVGSIGPTRGRCLAKLRQILDVDAEEGWWS
jgi:RNA polymerase sigma factor (sigma-70 family)